MKAKLPCIILALGVLSLSGCVETKKTSSTSPLGSNTGASKTVETGLTGSFNSLSDYLKRVPGLQLVNGVFQIRGVQSLDQAEPLYVINGSTMVNSYEMASSMIDPNDIDNIKVLKDVGQTSKYGMRGSHGVIEISVKTVN